MIRLRHMLMLLLVQVLGLSTLGAGVAQGQAPAVGQMVICTGHGIVTVEIDSQGNPVERRQLCPDNAASLILSHAIAAPLIVPLVAAPVAADWPVQQILHLRPVVLKPGARAPPGLARA